MACNVKLNCFQMQPMGGGLKINSKTQLRLRRGVHPFWIKKEKNNNPLTSVATCYDSPAGIYNCFALRVDWTRASDEMLSRHWWGLAIFEGLVWQRNPQVVLARVIPRTNWSTIWISALGIDLLLWKCQQQQATFFFFFYRCRMSPIVIQCDFFVFVSYFECLKDTALY